MGERRDNSRTLLTLMIQVMYMKATQWGKEACRDPFPFQVSGEEGEKKGGRRGEEETRGRTSEEETRGRTNGDEKEQMRMRERRGRQRGKERDK